MTRVQDIVLACVLLGVSGIAAMVILVWGATAPVPQVSVTDTQPVKSTPDTADRLPDLTRAAVARPVFQPSRRPASVAPPPVDTAAVQPADVSLSLTGVVTDGETFIALVRLSNSPELHRVTSGAKLDRWTILAIGPRGVTLTDEDGTPHVLVVGQ